MMHDQTNVDDGYGGVARDGQMTSIYQPCLDDRRKTGDARYGTKSAYRFLVLLGMLESVERELQLFGGNPSVFDPLREEIGEVAQTLAEAIHEIDPDRKIKIVAEGKGWFSER